MAFMPCLRCGALVAEGSYCPAHQPSHPSRKTEGRASRAQARFRDVVIKRAGGQCEAWEGEPPVRCTVTEGLEAHHLGGFKRKQSMDPRDGLAVCPAHHRQIEASEQAEAGLN